jgi:hypothetical protein
MSGDLIFLEVGRVILLGLVFYATLLVGAWGWEKVILLLVSKLP